MLSKLSFLIVLLSLFCFSCHKDLSFNYNNQAAFDDLWNSVSRYSASIETRQINWDSLYNVYSPLIDEEMSEAAYFEVISKLLLVFKDPHIWLISPFETVYTIDRLGYKRNINIDLIKDKYLTQIEVHTASIISGVLMDSIGYIYAKDFMGDRIATINVYDAIIEKMLPMKGLIIDFRENIGGSAYNAQALLNHLSDKRRLWHTTQNRIANGFDEPHQWFLTPKAPIYSNKVVLLTGRYTISAGERFVMGAQLLNNVTTVGDTTANTQGLRRCWNSSR